MAPRTRRIQSSWRDWLSWIFECQKGSDSWCSGWKWAQLTTKCRAKRHAWRDSRGNLSWSPHGKSYQITKVLEHFLRGVLVENGAGKLKPWIRMKKALSAVNEPFFIFLKMVYHKVYPHFIWKKTLNIIPDLRPRPLPCPWGERGGTERRRATKTWPRRFVFEWDKMVVFHEI